MKVNSGGDCSSPGCFPQKKKKLLVDTKAGSVLYTEASKDVVDFLLSLLSLPLGAVAKLLTAGAGSDFVVPPLDGPAAPSSSVAKLLPTVGAMVGSVGSLHRSTEALDAGHYVCRREATGALLETAFLQLVAAAPAPSGRLFRCKRCPCSPRCYDYAARVRGTPCPVCKGCWD